MEILWELHNLHNFPWSLTPCHGIVFQAPQTINIILIRFGSKGFKVMIQAEADMHGGMIHKQKWPFPGHRK